MPLIVMTGPNTFQYYEDGRPGTTGNVDVISGEEAAAMGYEPGDMYHREDPRNKRNRVQAAPVEGGTETVVEPTKTGGDTQQIAGATIGEDGIQGGAATGGPMGGGLVPGAGMSGVGSNATEGTPNRGLGGYTGGGVGDGGTVGERAVGMMPDTANPSSADMAPTLSPPVSGAGGVGPDVNIPQPSFQDMPNWRQSLMDEGPMPPLGQVGPPALPGGDLPSGPTINAPWNPDTPRYPQGTGVMNPSPIGPANPNAPMPGGFGTGFNEQQFGPAPNPNLPQWAFDPRNRRIPAHIPGR